MYRSLVQLWHGTCDCERLLYEMLKVAHEQTSVAGPHLGAHGHPTDLVEDLSIKLECIQSDDKYVQQGE